MSSDVIVHTENLGKCYEIYDRPKDRLLQMLARGRKQYFREFWALRNISLEIRRGENVGIVGHNGSGKSTLLQLLAGTLNQTTGTVSVSGRVAALLELGSGFNPEYSGRENVKMYAQLLGMSDEQIDERFDRIVDFSEIGDFIDQPLKTYSSGMYVRLAFSVAVHVNPEILIVDEALSVGDAFFQAKCMALLKKLMDDGVTLLFVSHDPGAVKALCSRAVLLDHGSMLANGDTESVVETYYAQYVQRRQSIAVSDDKARVTDAADKAAAIAEDAESEAAFKSRSSYQRLQNGMAEYLNVTLLDSRGRPARSADFGEQVTLRVKIRVQEDLPRLSFGYHIKDKNGFDIVYSDSGIEQCNIESPRAGSVHVVDWTFRARLKEGEYTVAAVLAVPVDLSIGLVETCDHVPIACQFRIDRAGHLPIYGATAWDNKVTVIEVQTPPLLERV
ncbi:ABC transporter ATP-binding protein [Cupriavidus alkaliphilus]|uniref:ABC transporter ATP-binding protein n=1 Tax=Cupriavidus alkaliphilus TaxID=942866 RepID=UPI0016170911|nr:ABC transporter ATP-binding protein [Cupriavidus alkaliphilus]MBB2916078.1 lipopolysaccharide transport system ATP-binding protein [Cupriavidus alkaliphilus]